MFAVTTSLMSVAMSSLAKSSAPREPLPLKLVDMIGATVLPVTAMDLRQSANPLLKLVADSC
jgi:hypothetical protein